MCFTKDVDNYFVINHLLSLPTIQHETIYDLAKIDKQELVAHVTKLHDAQKAKKKSQIKEEEERVVTDIAQVQAVTFYVEASTKPSQHSQPPPPPQVQD